MKTKAFKEQKHPVLAYDKNGVKVYGAKQISLQSNQKELVEVYINTQPGLTDINAEVLYSVWADLYNIQQSQLSTEAAIAGMSVSLAPSNGLVLSMSGFTDKQDVLLKQALSGLKADVTAQAFNQAIDRYKRGLLNQQKQFPYAQAFGAYSKLIRTGSFDTDALINAAESLSVADLNNLKTATFAKNDLRVFSYGNYNQQDIDAIAGELALRLKVIIRTVSLRVAKHGYRNQAKHSGTSKRY
ncbi:hypothetical protein ACOBV9_20230 (plasmid) [Pseudoalteromonas espejiana]